MQKKKKKHCPTVPGQVKKRERSLCVPDTAYSSSSSIPWATGPCSKKNEVHAVTVRVFLCLKLEWKIRPERKKEKITAFFWDCAKRRDSMRIKNGTKRELCCTSYNIYDDLDCNGNWAWHFAWHCASERKEEKEWREVRLNDNQSDTLCKRTLQTRTVYWKCFFQAYGLYLIEQK